MVYVVIIFLGLFIAYVKHIERHAIFFPMKGMELTPEHLDLAFEDLYLETKDGVRLNAWFIPAADARYSVLFCHGNAGNLGHRLEKLADLLCTSDRWYTLRMQRGGSTGWFKPSRSPNRCSGRWPSAPASGATEHSSVHPPTW